MYGFQYEKSGMVSDYVLCVYFENKHMTVLLDSAGCSLTIHRYFLILDVKGAINESYFGFRHNIFCCVWNVTEIAGEKSEPPNNLSVASDYDMIPFSF